MKSITFQNILSPNKTQYVQKWLDMQPMDFIFAENSESINEKNNELTVTTESYLSKSKCLPIVKYKKVIIFIN